MVVVKARGYHPYSQHLSLKSQNIKLYNYNTFNQKHTLFLPILASLEGDGSENHLVIDRCQQRADEGPHPEHPVVMPGHATVVDDSSAERPCWVDAGAGDRNGRQVNKKHREPNRQRREDRHVRVTRAALGVSGGEHRVDQHERTHDLRTEAVTLRVAVRHDVGATPKRLVLGPHVALDDAGAADGAQALHDHVIERPRQRQFPREKQPKGDGGVDVAARDTGGAVDEREDHASEGPRDALYAHAVLADVVGALDAHDGEYGDVEEKKSGHELGYAGSPEGP
eukprot:TRINITY_DN95_c0_g2_i1.p2 TRINITY_DN95_c0_g2~~TRINITY_DN95_c0_g2_i1.p2  ORF type:complete len:282 (-),score=-6.92 TRINITY_DN95_c0_g2_i1:323-1168(-)